ncbi:glutamate transport system permease protein [Mumia flava]|uniref:Glutamate transport system permease protein n=1 Tax=Mumia flava TaxID=1348852 RepID=A0A2M9BE30_9ACTN|nr:amino acid ABC transporter permease [Mumia flava]PJJ56196.1 glutamate transport system permease protein [Mumia flava]
MSTVLYDAPGPRARRLYRTIGIISSLVLIAIAALVIYQLYKADQFTEEVWEPFVTPRIMELLWQGLLDTIRAAVLAIIGAVLFGIVFGIGKLSEHAWIRWPCWLVVEFFRAVPLVMLIFFVWSLYSLQPDRSYISLVISLVLYNGAVLAEVFRAGINALPNGQSEAAYAVGMRKNQVMTAVLLPQAVKIMLPSIISQCVVALKDTSLGYLILAPGLTTAGRLIWGTFGNYLATALVLLMLYLVLNLLLERLAVWAERRFSQGRKLHVDAVGALGDEERTAAEKANAVRFGPESLGGGGQGRT